MTHSFPGYSYNQHKHSYKIFKRKYMNTTTVQQFSGPAYHIVVMKYHVKITLLFYVKMVVKTYVELAQVSNANANISSCLYKNSYTITSIIRSRLDESFNQSERLCVVVERLRGACNLDHCWTLTERCSCGLDSTSRSALGSTQFLVPVHPFFRQPR